MLAARAKAQADDKEKETLSSLEQGETRVIMGKFLFFGILSFSIFCFILFLFLFLFLFFFKYIYKMMELHLIHLHE